MLVRLTGGELDALEDLYDRYKTMAYSIAYRITNDRRSPRTSFRTRSWARGGMPPAMWKGEAA